MLNELLRAIALEIGYQADRAVVNCRWVEEVADTADNHKRWLANNL